MSIDLNLYAQLQEDLYDVALARERAEEARKSFASVKRQLSCCRVFGAPTFNNINDFVENVSARKARRRSPNLIGRSSG